MNYIFENKTINENLQLYTFKKFDSDIYYRDVVLETNRNIKLSLADISLPNGISRVDKNKSTDSIQVRLAHYSLPNIHGNIRTETSKVKGYEVKIIDNGTLSVGY